MDLIIALLELIGGGDTAAARAIQVDLQCTVIYDSRTGETTMDCVEPGGGSGPELDPNG